MNITRAGWNMWFLNFGDPKTAPFVQAYIRTYGFRDWPKLPYITFADERHGWCSIGWLCFAVCFHRFTANQKRLSDIEREHNRKHWPHLFGEQVH